MGESGAGGHFQAFETYFLIAHGNKPPWRLQMTDVEFKKGDTVQMKSGGPIMTVTNIGDRLGELAVWCMWFEKTKKMEDTFPPEALEKVTKPTGDVYVGRTTRG
jgi:uncharacterized protein YodC (DUF2158 family)